MKFFLAALAVSLVSSNTINFPLKSQKTAFSKHSNNTALASLVKSDSKLITAPIEDYQDVQIFTEIYVGSQKEKFKVIFDTGSDWIWIYSRVCENCPMKKFDESQSESFKFYNVIYDLHYGSGDVYGYISHD